jgi:Mg2+/Co2+ transporter CorB
MIYILVIMTCIICAAFFSGAETAIVSCNRIRIRHLAKGLDRKAQVAEKLLAKPEKVLATTLVGTNIFMLPPTRESFSKSMKACVGSLPP